MQKNTCTHTYTNRHPDTLTNIQQNDHIGTHTHTNIHKPIHITTNIFRQKTTEKENQN